MAHKHFVLDYVIVKTGSSGNKSHKRIKLREPIQQKHVYQNNSSNLTINDFFSLMTVLSILNCASNFDLKSNGDVKCMETHHSENEVFYIQNVLLVLTVWLLTTIEDDNSFKQTKFDIVISAEDAKFIEHYKKQHCISKKYTLFKIVLNFILCVNFFFMDMKSYGNGNFFNNYHHIKSMNEYQKTFVTNWI